MPKPVNKKVQLIYINYLEISIFSTDKQVTFSVDSEQKNDVALVKRIKPFQNFSKNYIS